MLLRVKDESESHCFVTSLVMAGSHGDSRLGRTEYHFQTLDLEKACPKTVNCDDVFAFCLGDRRIIPFRCISSSNVFDAGLKKQDQQIWSVD